MRKCMVIGHRGASSEAPENTMKSFRRAWEIGCDMIELDVQETSDGHIVCIHDYDVSSTTSGGGMVAELSLKEIHSLDAGEGERVPLLTDVLDFAKANLGVDIELKTFDMESRILDMVRERDMLDKVMFSSFFHGTLQEIIRLESEAFTAVLLNRELENPVEYTLELDAKAINPEFKMIDADFVDSAHKAALKVYPWTVNDEDLMKDLLKMNVDGIITDIPALAIHQISKYSS